MSAETVSQPEPSRPCADASGVRCCVVSGCFLRRTCLFEPWPHVDANAHRKGVARRDWKEDRFNMSSQSSGPLRSLYSSFIAGEIDRRTFVQRATMLGVGTAGVAFLANNVTSVAAQDASPAASPASGVSAAPAEGTEGQERGA